MTAESEQVLARLQREGRFTPARQDPASWPSRIDGPTRTLRDVDELLAEMRGEH